MSGVNAAPGGFRLLVDCSWGQVAARSFRPNTEGPPLLLVHQSPLSSGTFAPALGLLARGSRPICLDTPGYGASDPPPRQWTLPEYAAALWEVVDRLGIDRPVLLGQHTGATIALEAALQQPGRARGLVFNGLPLYTREERARRGAGYAPRLEAAADGSHLRWIWDRVMRLYPHLNAEQATAQVEDYLATGLDYAAAYRAVFDYPVEGRVSGLSGPVLLLYGDHDLVAHMQPRVKESLPQSIEHVIEGATDLAAAEVTEEFARAVLDFAAELD